MGMTIDSGAKVRFRIVQVKGQNLVKPNKSFESSDSGIPSPFGSYVEARGEEMSSVQADSKPLRTSYRVEYCREMLGFVPEAAPLARGVFQRDPHAGPFCRRKDVIQARRDP